MQEFEKIFVLETDNFPAILGASVEESFNEDPSNAGDVVCIFTHFTLPLPVRCFVT